MYTTVYIVCRDGLNCIKCMEYVNPNHTFTDVFFQHISLYSTLYTYVYYIHIYKVHIRTCGW